MITINPPLGLLIPSMDGSEGYKSHCTTEPWSAWNWTAPAPEFFGDVKMNHRAGFAACPAH